MTICACGCGNEIPYKRWHKQHLPRFIHGHNTTRPPKLDSEKYGIEIGRNNRNIYVWQECPKCHNYRWTRKRKHIANCIICHRAFGKENPKWKGGREKGKDGYIRLVLEPGDFFFSMTAIRDHSVLEHRLVMAKSLGRCLHRWEIVHHKNHIRDDNRIENLQLVSDDRHTQITIMENRIRFLEKENALLKSQLSSYPNSISK